MKNNVLRRSILTITLVMLMIVFTGWSANAAGQTNNSAVDPSALAALDQMGAYMRTLKVFRLDAAVQREEVLDNGIKVQFHGFTSLVAQRPNRLKVDSMNNEQERQYFYDGKQFTLWAPLLNNYATVPAPTTIGELADMIEQKFDIELPFVDLFRWSSDTSGKGITAAVDIGSGKIDGADCRHFAFRQEGLDWQIWIQAGDQPLPRKLVFTTTTDEARPQYQAVCTWNLAPKFNDETFTFVPPTNAIKIVFSEVKPDAGTGKEEK